MSSQFSDDVYFANFDDDTGEKHEWVGRFWLHHTSDVYSWMVWPKSAGELDFSRRGEPSRTYYMSPYEFAAMCKAIKSLGDD